MDLGASYYLEMVKYVKKQGLTNNCHNVVVTVCASFEHLFN